MAYRIYCKQAPKARRFIYIATHKTKRSAQEAIRKAKRVGGHLACRIRKTK